MKQIRDSGNEDKKNEIEYNITKKIFDVLCEYPYHLDDNNNGYQPSKILSTKEVYCVGFSILCHAFLSELGIKHKGVNTRGHSYNEVYIGKVVYKMDVSSGVFIQKSNYIYQSYNINEVGTIEDILLSQIKNNLSNIGGLTESERLNIREQALKLGYYNAQIINLITSYFNTGRYEEAVEKAKFLIDNKNKYPEDFLFAIKINFLSLYKLGKIPEALDLFIQHNMINMDFNGISLLKNFEDILKSGKYNNLILNYINNSINSFDLYFFTTIIKYFPDNSMIYNKISENISDEYIKSLYFTAGKIISGDNVQINTDYEQQIKKLKDINDYNGIYNYIKELEKNRQYETFVDILPLFKNIKKIEL